VKVRGWPTDDGGFTFEVKTKGCGPRFVAVDKSMMRDGRHPRTYLLQAIADELSRVMCAMKPKAA
jgi:hypothetical protein